MLPSIIRRSCSRRFATCRPPLANLSDDVRKTIADHPAMNEVIFQQLSTNPDCFQLVSELRSTIALQKEQSSIKTRVADPLDQLLRTWLSTEVETDAVSMRRIDFKSSKELPVINKIIEGDAVHGSDNGSIKEVASRENRRCYALFHQSSSHDPLAFIHVALTNNIATSMR